MIITELTCAVSFSYEVVYNTVPRKPLTTWIKREESIKTLGGDWNEFHDLMERFIEGAMDRTVNMGEDWVKKLKEKVARTVPTLKKGAYLCKDRDERSNTSQVTKGRESFGNVPGKD